MTTSGPVLLLLPYFSFNPVHDLCLPSPWSVSICWFASWTEQCEWSPTKPNSGSRAVFPISGAPDTCEMVLSRGLGTVRRRVLLGRAHCSQLELRLHTVILHRKAKRSWSPRAWGDQSSSDTLAETSMMLQRAPLCPSWHGSFSWCGLWRVSLWGRGWGRPPASQFGK